MAQNEERIQRQYEDAKAVYAGFGVDTDEALAEFRRIPLSLHCWQGDDVKGFEDVGDVASQNLVTGQYPGAAATATSCGPTWIWLFAFLPAGIASIFTACMPSPKPRRPATS